LGPEGIEIDKKRYPVNGFDVSRHTGKIDFKKFKSAFPGPVDFVYIKATEGKNFVDKNFSTNYKNVRKNRIPVGAYNFFNFNVSGTKQADNFLKAIRGKKFDLPLVVDVEEWGNRPPFDEAVIVKEIAAFVKTVEKCVNTRMVFYSNESSYRRYLEGRFDNPIWICSFKPNPKIDKKWLFWQHSHRGKFAGAEGWVVLNTFNGSRQEWESYLKYRKKILYR
jgi:lysozyme